MIQEMLRYNQKAAAHKNSMADYLLTEKLFCISPARNLSDHLKNSAGTVFFSATFLPLPYYRKLLSTREDDYGIYVPSPFPQETGSFSLAAM